MLATVNQVRNAFPYNESYVVVGIDPGIHNTATATIIDSQNTNSLRNISIPQSAHTFCTKVYMNGLNRAKRTKVFPIGGQNLNVTQIEQRITPIVCQRMANQQLTWTTLAASIVGHVVSVLQVQTALREFYSSKIFKIKTMHRKQAKIATLDKGVSRLCRAAGLPEKLSEEDPKPLFVVGDGQFGSRNTPITHQQFILFLKKKVCGLSYYVRQGYQMDHFRPITNFMRTLHVGGWTEWGHRVRRRISYIQGVLSMRVGRPIGRSRHPLSRLQPGEGQGPQCSDKYGQSSTLPHQRAGMASSVGPNKISLTWNEA